MNGGHSTRAHQHRTVSLTKRADAILTERAEAHGTSKSAIINGLLLTADFDSPWFVAYFDGLRAGMYDGSMAVRGIVAALEGVRAELAETMRADAERIIAARAASMPFGPPGPR